MKKQAVVSSDVKHAIAIKRAAKALEKVMEAAVRDGLTVNIDEPIAHLGIPAGGHNHISDPEFKMFYVPTIDVSISREIEIPKDSK